MRTGEQTRQTGSMNNPSKFLFDIDFSAPEEPEIIVPPEPEIPMMPVAEHEALLEQARRQAFEEGRAQAAEELKGGQELRLTDEVNRLVDAVGAAMSDLEEMEVAREKDATSLAFLVARRLCAFLIARQPLAETVALVTECLGPLRQAPHLVIRVAERDVEALKKRVDPIVHEKGFEGRLVLLGEPDIARGDCHIEWADGGILRDRKALEREIDSSIKTYLQARAASAAAHKAQKKQAAEKETDA